MNLILILDYGSQYTQLMARRIRDIGMYSLIVPASISIQEIEKHHPNAILLSGGPASVYDVHAPQLPENFWDFQKKFHIPVLGICYGMQLIVQSLGGKVEKAPCREYGRTRIFPKKTTAFFESFHKKIEEKHLKEGVFVWMSHGDSVSKIPPGFEISACSASKSPAIIENSKEKIYGFQFHPEVSHTLYGTALLKHFLMDLCQMVPDWNLKTFLEDRVESIRQQVSSEEHVICALSGGVDSLVAAMLVHKAVGDRLHCFFIDPGLLRMHEQKQVMHLFQTKLDFGVTCLDHSERFLKNLEGISDPEEKRKRIGADFIRSFEEAAHAISDKIHTKSGIPKFLVQGTLYPDVIESCASVSSKKETTSLNVTIKSHHNVGGLPAQMRFELIEPLRFLFKDEVRALGQLLHLPKEFLQRHPFPGPGLAVRIIGEIDSEKLKILRQVDEIFIDCIVRAGLYHQIWQAFAVFLPIKSVGVQGDGRTHDYVVALRAVTSEDGMTADWFRFEPDFLADVSSRICNQVPGVNRVVYDISSKPPATIEWE